MKFQTATTTVTVSLENVLVLEVSKVDFVKKWIVLILHVPITAFVPKELAFVRKVGRALIVH